MGSKDRVPPYPHRPLHDAGMIHLDPFVPGIHAPPSAFFDVLPPPEIMEQKLAAQHVEMQRLTNENQRLAATHGTLRQELAATQQELQRLQAHISAMKSEKKQQLNGFLGKISKMETDLKNVAKLKTELLQARAESENLVVVRQELVSKVQQLTQDLNKRHADVQQIPLLMTELEGLRREYQNCRVTHDYEKKLYNDHFESLQLMEKNYVSMAREVEKLRVKLGGQGGITAHKENAASGHYSVGQNAYEDSHGIPQVPGHSLIGMSTCGGHPPGPAHTRAGYDASQGPGYEATRVGNSDTIEDGYDAPKVAIYDYSNGAGYDAPRNTEYDASKAGYDATGSVNCDASHGAGYDTHRGAGYGSSRDSRYDASGGASYVANRAASDYGVNRAAGGIDIDGAYTGYDTNRAGAGYDANGTDVGYEANRRAVGYDATRGAAGYDMTIAAVGYEAPRSAGYNNPRGSGQVQPTALPGNSVSHGLTRDLTHAKPRGANANFLRR